MKETGNEEKAAQFEALVKQARSEQKRIDHRAFVADEDNDLLRSFAVNSLCLVLPTPLFYILFSVMGALWGRQVGSWFALGVVAIVVFLCFKIMRNDSLARWVNRGAGFFLIGTCLLLSLVVFGLPFLMLMAVRGLHLP